MITCCKCGGDCGPGEGVSMCLGCNELADMEVQDRSYQKLDLNDTEYQLVNSVERPLVNSVERPLVNIVKSFVFFLA